MLLIAVFYSIPSMQFVMVQYRERDKFSDQVYCYYNFKCDNHFLGLSSFNNSKKQMFQMNLLVLSNIGYITMGIVFLIIVRAQDKSDKTEVIFFCAKFSIF